MCCVAGASKMPLMRFRARCRRKTRLLRAVRKIPPDEKHADLRNRVYRRTKPRRVSGRRSVIRLGGQNRRNRYRRHATKMDDGWSEEPQLARPAGSSSWPISSAAEAPESSYRGDRYAVTYPGLHSVSPRRLKRAATKDRWHRLD